MEADKTHELPKDQPSATQMELQRALLLSWLTQSRYQIPPFVPTHGGSGWGSGPGPLALTRDAALKLIEAHSLKAVDEMARPFLTPKSELTSLIETLLKAED